MTIHSRSKQILLASLAAILALSTAAWATIVDDINPFGPRVRVTLRNTASYAVDGTLFVTANVQSSAGIAEQSGSAKYSIPAGEKADVIVEFTAKVKSVIEVKPVDDEK